MDSLEKILIKRLQEAMNDQGENLTVDGDLGPKTLAATEKYNFKIIATRKEENKKSSSPPWYLFALKFKGKKETDPEFAKMMVPKWKLVGLNLGTIAANWAAWCGLAMAVALAGVGVDYAKNGASAKNWDQYGVTIDWKKDGIPQGAIVRINHNLNCASSAGNHVAQANGDCTSQDLLKSGASIDLYGGNQGNTWKVSTFSAKEICAVRWPKDYEKPGAVLASKNCTSRGASSETTQ
ncbi:MAG: hypothetical protein ACKOX6_11330 [Bdellovibrio sp.]